jgi:hypothetical protein
MGSGGIAPLILWPRHYMEVSGQLHVPAALPQGKSPWYPLDRRLGEPQCRSERGGLEKNSQPAPGIEPQNPDRPARSAVICYYQTTWIYVLPLGLCLNKMCAFRFLPYRQLMKNAFEKYVYSFGMRHSVPLDSHSVMKPSNEPVREKVPTTISRVKAQ